jgi:hypothetical protein
MSKKIGERYLCLPEYIYQQHMWLELWSWCSGCMIAVVNKGFRRGESSLSLSFFFSFFSSSFLFFYHHFFDNIYFFSKVELTSSSLNLLTMIC